jgi:hypothetical protein
MNLIEASTKTNAASGGITNQSFTTSTFQEWNEPIRVDVIDTGNSIEMIYVQTKNNIWNYFPFSHEKRALKIVYSCVNGMWNKSEPIYGEVIPAQEEYYNFEQ